jgi:hypothetical protein
MAPQLNKFKGKNYLAVRQSPFTIGPSPGLANIIGKEITIYE